MGDISVSLNFRASSFLVASTLLSLRVGRWFFGRPMIFILLVCICSISSSKYLGRPPHTGDAYSKIGLIFYIYVVSPISTGRLDLRHSRKWNSFLQALQTVWWTCVFHLGLFCCHTSRSLKVSTLSIVSVSQRRGGGSEILFETHIHISLVFFEFNSILLLDVHFTTSSTTSCILLCEFKDVSSCFVQSSFVSIFICTDR